MSMFAAANGGIANRAIARRTESNPRAGRTDEATLGALAISIVHDLRNPLAAIYSGAEMLSRPGLSGNEVQRLARNMYASTLRIQQLVENWAELSRGTVHRGDPLDVREMVSKAVDAIAEIASGQGVVVENTVPENLLVAVEHSRLDSVLSNLLANALEAMPNGGSILISALAEGNAAVIRVADTGPGIAPEIRDRLFQPFVTAGKANGWGLGLSSARRILMENGGAIWLESSSESGTCFTFRLPVFELVCAMIQTAGGLQ